MHEIVLLRAAEAELLEASLTGGERCAVALESGLHQLALQPYSGPTFSGSFRRLVADRHWGIFYAVGSRRVMVTAILDLRQDPARIRQRLSS